MLLSGQKSTLFEGGIHVPFVISCPGKFKAGTVYDKPVISLDILPTIIGLAGGEISDKDRITGVNLLPYIRRTDNNMPHDYLMWNYGGYSAIRHGDLKMINMPYKFPLLFDLSKDISEKNDIALKMKRMADMMIEKLGLWNMYCPEPLFHQGNGQKLEIRKQYDEVSPPQPGTQVRKLNH
jgi:arylsulfatase A-like enzyme